MLSHARWLLLDHPPMNVLGGRKVSSGIAPITGSIGQLQRRSRHLASFGFLAISANPHRRRFSLSHGLGKGQTVSRRRPPRPHSLHFHGNLGGL